MQRKKIRVDDENTDKRKLSYVRDGKALREWSHFPVCARPLVESLMIYLQSSIATRGPRHVSIFFSRNNKFREFRLHGH